MNYIISRIRAVNKEGMSRLPKRMQQQVKRVAPPAVPETYRHSGSSFSSAGYGSCDDTTTTIFVASARNTTNSTNNNTSASLDQTDQINRTTMQSNSSAPNSGYNSIELLCGNNGFSKCTRKKNRFSISLKI